MRYPEDSRVGSREQRIGMMKFAYVIAGALVFNGLANYFEALSHLPVVQWFFGGC